MTDSHFKIPFFSNVSFNELDESQEAILGLYFGVLSSIIRLIRNGTGPEETNRYDALLYHNAREAYGNLKMITPEPDRVIRESEEYMTFLAEEMFQWNGDSKRHFAVEDYFSHRYDFLAALATTYALTRQSMIDYLKALSINVEDYRRAFANDKNIVVKLQQVLFTYGRAITESKENLVTDVAPRHLRYGALLTNLLVSSDRVYAKFTPMDTSQYEKAVLAYDELVKVWSEGWFDIDGVPRRELDGDFLLFVRGYMKFGNT